jgi:hypothetical protein
MSRQCTVPDCDRPLSSKGYCKMHAERVRRHGHPGLEPRKGGKSLADRLWAKVDKSAGPDACWPFTDKLTVQGYGRIRVGGAGSKTVGAHRAAYILTFPDHESPEVLDHLCHDPQVCDLGDECPHRRCCNPSHLTPSTFVENSALGRQRTKSFLTECAKGHLYDEANTRFVPGVGRRCRKCDAAAARDRRRRTRR